MFGVKVSGLGEHRVNHVVTMAMLKGGHKKFWGSFYAVA